MANVKLNIVTATNLQGLNQLKAKLEEVKKIAQSADEGGFFNLSAEEIHKTVTTVNTLERALKTAYDTKLNTINIEKFNRYLSQSNITIKNLYTNLSRVGVEGKQAFIDMTQTTLMMGRSVKQTNKLVEEMQTTMMNTVKWGISSGLWNTMLSSVSQAWGYIKGLNSDLTDIRIVTGKSADQMERFAKTANKAAKDLGVATRDYTQGALLYYQQGDDDETVKIKTDITAKASNITGQDMSTVSEQLTAVWNGYQVANQAAEEGMQVYEEYVDKLSAVAATTASDLEEQATAMSKVASAAYSMGVNFDDLNAQIATIVSVTRQAPESVGTALKTIYARLGDLKVNGVDEFGIKLGEVSGQLQTMGIEVLDSNGNMREMSTVMTEVAGKWDTWTSAQKQAAAVAMAGKRQYNNLIALFDNWDMYGESLKTSMEATGTLSEQQSIAMDSLEKKMQRMTVASEKFYDALFDEQSIGGLIDGLTTIVDLLGSMVKGVGGLSSILPTAGGLMLKTFGGKIGETVARNFINTEVRAREIKNDDAKLALARQLGESGKYITTKNDEKDELLEEEQNIQINNYKEMLKYRKNMTNEEINAYNIISKTRAEIAKKKLETQEQIKKLKEENKLTKEQYDVLKKINRGKELEKNSEDKEVYDKFEKIIEVQPLVVNKARAEVAPEKFITNLADSSSASQKIEGIVTGAYGTKGSQEDIAKDINIINRELKKAKDEGLDIESTISLIKTKLNEVSKIKYGDSIFNDLRKAIFDDNLGNALSKSLKKVGADTEAVDVVLQKLSKRINKLIKQGLSFGDAYEQSINEIEEEAIEFQKITNNINTNNIETENSNLDFDDFKKTQEIKSDIEELSNVIGSLFQISGAFNGILGAFNSAMDSSLSVTDRLTASFSGLLISMLSIISTIPNLINGIEKIKTGFSTLGTAISKMFSIKKIPSGSILAILAVLAVAIAGVTAAMAFYQEELNRAAAAAERKYKASKELADEAKKEKEAIDSIVKSYEELSKDYEKNEKSLNDLQTQTADLCLEYDRQDLALKALISDYDELNTLLKEAQETSTLDFIEKNKDAIKAGQTSAVAKIIKEGASAITDEDEDGRATLDVIDGIWADYDEKLLHNVLKKYGISFAGEGHIYTDDFVEAISKNYDKILNEIGSINGDAAKELISIMELVSDNVNEIKEMEDENQKAYLNRIAQTYKDKDFNSYEDYNKAIEDMASKASIYFDSLEEARQWASGQLISKENLKYNNIDKIIQQEKQKNPFIDEDKFIKNLEKLSDKELNFALQYFDMKAIDESFEEFAKKYANFIDYLTKENQIVPTIESILINKDAKEVTETELDSLFSSDDFEKAMNISREQFEVLDFEKQRLLMSQYYLDYQKYITENKDAIVKSIEETANELNNMEIDFEGHDKEWIKEIGNIDDLKETYKKEFSVLSDFHGISEKQVLSLFEKLGSGISIDGLSKEEKDILLIITGKKPLTPLGKIWDIKNIKDIGKAIVLNKRYEAQVRATTEALEKAKKGEANYLKALQDARAQYTYINEGIDNIQDGFSQLTSIVEDFNDNGTLSLDNLQILLTMSDEMLACLELENGQMSINSDRIKEMTLARLNEAKATIMQETQSGLLNIVNKKVAESENQAAYQAFLRSETVLKGAEAARISGDEWLRYNAIVGEVDLSDIYNSQEAQDFLEGQRIKLLNLESTIEGIQNTDFSLISGSNSDEELKKLDDEFDRYWDLNKAIDATTEALSDLQDVQDKLTRGELQDSLKEQNELLEKQIINYKNLRKEQEKEAAELRGKLLNYGADFAQDGSLINYKELANEALAYYNNAATMKNQGLITDSKFESAEEKYEEFKETLARYDELYYNELIETADKIAEEERKILANNLENFEVTIQTVIDKEDFERDLNDFFEEASANISKRFDDLNSKQHFISLDAQGYKNSLDAVLNGFGPVIEEIKKLAAGESSTMFESLTQAQEKLKELTKNSIDYASGVGNAFEEAWDTYLEGIDQEEEKIQDAMNGYEKVNETLEYQSQLIELIYGPEAYELLDTLYKQQQDNTSSQIRSLQQQKEMWKSLYAAAEEGSKDQKKYFDLMNEAQSKLNESVIEYIDLLKNEYSNAINSIIDNLENKLTGGSSFEDVEEQWERMTKHTDKYYDNLESIYEIQTLSNKISQDISELDDIKDKQKLQKILDKELTFLREKDYLSKTDLDISSKKLEIAKAEMALEDAQASKSSMRLTRGADGNWSYQYVADADNIVDKQQELLNNQNDLYQLTQDAYKDSLEKIVDLEQATKNKIKEIANSEVLTQEEKEKKIADTLKWYTQEKDIIVQNSELYRQQTIEASAGLVFALYAQDVINFESMTEEEQKLVKSLKENMIKDYSEIETAIKNNLEGIGSTAKNVAETNIPQMTSASQNLATEWSADKDGVKASIMQAFEDIIKAMNNYQNKMDEVAKDTKKDFGEEGIKKEIRAIKTETELAEQAMLNLCENIPNKLIKLKDSISPIASTWDTVKKNINQAADALSKYYNLQGIKHNKETTPGTLENIGVGNGASFGSITSDVKPEGGDEKGLENQKPVAFLDGATPIYASPNGNTKYQLDREQKEYGVAAYEYDKNINGLYPVKIKLMDGSEGYVRPEYLYGVRMGDGHVPYNSGKLINFDFNKKVGAGSFDTGGYTGEWGSTGKIAMLHEKELVLNKEDTSNILAAVNGIRQFSSIESAISKGIASMIMSMTGMGVNVNYNTNEAKGNQTKQVFNIQAEFPNANSVSEIKEAILSLPGLASQQVGLNLI